MNRRERRLASKRMGIMQHQKKLPIEKRYELIRENIKYGKKKMEEDMNSSNLMNNTNKSEKESQVIYERAQQIAHEKSIPLVDALDEAHKEFS